MDDWTVTRVHRRPDGMIDLAGVSRSRGMFQLMMPTSEYELHGPWPAVRAYLEHHPCDIRPGVR